MSRTGEVHTCLSARAANTLQGCLPSPAPRAPPPPHALPVNFVHHLGALTASSQVPHAVQDWRSLPTVCTPVQLFPAWPSDLGQRVAGLRSSDSQSHLGDIYRGNAPTPSLCCSPLVLFLPPAPQRLLGAWGGQSPGSHFTPALWRLPPPSPALSLSICTSSFGPKKEISTLPPVRDTDHVLSQKHPHGKPSLHGLSVPRDSPSRQISLRPALA